MADEARNANRMSEEALVTELLRERDVLCPGCAYNLRNLTQPQCPECGHHLAVELTRPAPKLGWLLVTLAPMCGAAALGILFLIVGMMLGIDELIPFICFGWFDVVIAWVIAANARSFITLPTRWQICWAAASWLAHGLLFLMLAILM